MPRKNCHKVGVKAVDVFRLRVNSYDENGVSSLFRELSEQDYGIDGIVEIFEDDYPTGKIGYIQIKGTEKQIVPQVRNNVVACPNVSYSTFSYAKQERIPVILCYVSITGDSPIYFVLLQECINQLPEEENESKTAVVKIPPENMVLNNVGNIIDIINNYYL